MCLKNEMHERTVFSFENLTQVLHSVQDDNQPEAGPWNDVILRSGARKNLGLVLKDLKTRSFALLRTTTNPRPVP